MQIKRSLIVVCVAASASLSACGDKAEDAPINLKSTAPAVNDENCKPEAIARIGNKEIQQQFSGACLRRTPSSSGAPNKSW